MQILYVAGLRYLGILVSSIFYIFERYTMRKQLLVTIMLTLPAGMQAQVGAGALEPPYGFAPLENVPVTRTLCMLETDTDVMYQWRTIVLTFGTAIDYTPGK